MKRHVLCLWFGLLGLGCAGRQPVHPVAPALRLPPPSGPIPALRSPTIAAAYRIGCHDVVRVRVNQEADFLACVDLDGRIELGAYGRPRIEGQTVESAPAGIAEQARLDPAAVKVELVQVRAARIYLHGPELGKQRPYPYAGPERVVDCLQRIGAIKPGQSDLRDVAVIRPNLALGGKPEVFHVDWLAISQGDQTTNLILNPSDSVFVGETRRSSFSRMLPDWLVPFYRRCMGLLPPAGWPWIREPHKLAPESSPILPK